VPVYAFLLGVARGVPGREFAIEIVDGRDTAFGEALYGHGGEFEFGYIEPGTMFGGEVYFETLG